MPSYSAPTKDLQFVLHDVLKVTEAKTPGYDELEADFTSAILEEAGKLTSDVLAPLNVGEGELQRPGRKGTRMFSRWHLEERNPSIDVWICRELQRLALRLQVPRAVLYGQRAKQ